METVNLISIEQFCTHWNIETSFIHSLHEAGLVEIIVREESHYFLQEQLQDVEKMIRFHFDLNINIEGIDVIANLLNQIRELRNQLRRAQYVLNTTEAAH